MPVFNQRPDLLDRAVRSATEQTVPVEVIVVDDGSSPPVVDRGGYWLATHQENCGIAAALNTGIAAMTTPWFCWLSSDDTIYPNKVERQLADLEASGIRAAFHRYLVQQDDLAPTEISILPAKMRGSRKHQRQALGTGCAINGSTVMIHRSVFDTVGMFDTSYKYGQDWEMWCRIAQSYQWLAMDETLGTRTRGGNLTERIDSDPDLRAARDAEDERIRRQYGPR